MSTQILYAPLDPATIGPASRYIRETRDELLAYDVEELAAVRLSILLTAKWVESESEDPERRDELRQDLAILRKHYGDMLDEIAMTFGVNSAMKAKEEVEESVVIPSEKPSEEELCGEYEGGAGDPGL
jgi:hypothetical protein